MGLKVEKKLLWSLMCLEAPESTRKVRMLLGSSLERITRHLMSWVDSPFLCLFLCFFCVGPVRGVAVFLETVFLFVMWAVAGTASWSFVYITFCGSMMIFFSMARVAATTMVELSFRISICGERSFFRMFCLLIGLEHTFLSDESLK
jgi:hypothetical protein